MLCQQNCRCLLWLFTVLLTRTVTTRFDNGQSGRNIIARVTRMVGFTV